MTFNRPTPKMLRLAGILYLIIIVCGIFSEGFIRTSIQTQENLLLISNGIPKLLLQLRLALTSDLIMIIADIFLAIVFFQIFRIVNKLLSATAAVFRLFQAAILCVISLIHAATYILPIFLESTDQFPQILMALFEIHSTGYLISGVFFGISCIILGYLSLKSSFVPRILGSIIMIAGWVYISDSIIHFLIPSMARFSEIAIWVIALFAEVGFCLWLLTRTDHSITNQGFEYQ